MDSGWPAPRSEELREKLHSREKHSWGQIAPVWMSVLVAVLGCVTAALYTAQLIAQPTAASAIPLTLIAPAAAVALAWWADAYSRSRAGVYAWTLAWGAVVATFVAGLMNSVAAVLGGEATAAVLSAPMVEESLKLAGVLIILRWLGGIDSPLKGAILGVCAGAGFTLVEDIQYLFADTDSLQTALLRLSVKPLLHMGTTAIAGAGIGWAAGQSRSSSGRALAIIAAIAAAMVLHASWNGNAVLEQAASSNGWTTTLLASQIIGLTLSVCSTGGLVVALAIGRRRYGRRVRAGATVLVSRGLLDGTEADLAGDLRARRRAARDKAALSEVGASAAVICWSVAVGRGVSSAEQVRLAQARQACWRTSRYAER